MPADELLVTGEVKSYTVTNHAGRLTSREFCANCGSPLFTRYPRMVFIKAGTIDDSEALQPTRQIWTEMAVPWSRIPDGLETHPLPQPGQKAGAGSEARLREITAASTTANQVTADWH